MVCRAGGRTLSLLQGLRSKNKGDANHTNSGIFPHHSTMPALSSADAATAAATALTHALANPAPAAPFVKLGDAQLEAIKQLSSIFETAIQQKNDTITHGLPRVNPSKQCSASPAPQRVVAPVPASPVPTPGNNDAHPVPVTPPRVRSHLHHQPHSRPSAPTTNTSPRVSHPHLIPPDDTEPMQRHHYNLRPRYAALAFLAAQPVHPAFTPYSHHHANAVLDPLSGRELEYRHLSRGPDAEVWIRALSNDLGRLA